MQLVGIRHGGERSPPEGVVNAPSTESGSRGPGQPVTDAAIARLTGTLRAANEQVGANVDAFLAKVTMAAGQHVPGTEHVGITLVERGKQVRSQSATDIRPLILDGIQQRCKCGPILDLDDDHPAGRVDDLAAETRWPTFVGPVLACSPIRSMLSFQLFSLDGVRGVLTVYATQPCAFPADATRIGEVLAAETLLAVQRDGSELLNPSVATDPVEQASRILMDRYDIDKLAAYSLLVRLAKGSGHTVAAAARRLIQADPSDNHAEVAR
jgi:ANTAR domain